MAIGRSAFPTANWLPGFCANDSPPEHIENGTDLVQVVCDPFPLPFPANATPFPLTDDRIFDRRHRGTLTLGGLAYVDCAWGL